MNFNLIVPIAANRPEYDKNIPYLFSLDNRGLSLCVNSILGLNFDCFDNIYFTILDKHAKQYSVDKLLNLQFERLNISNAHVVILDDPTQSQPETVYKTIISQGISGSFYIKDADSYFRAQIKPKNSVGVYPLEQMDIANPQNKSYVVVDDMFHITNIIEKRIIGPLFSAGGYGFESIDDFCAAFNMLNKYDNLYISHIIYSLLLKGKTFTPIQVEDYRDWGTEKLFTIMKG